MPRYFRLLLVALFLSACGGAGLKLQRWEKLPKAEYTIPPYARRLARFKIALDPGHGGNASIPKYKRGPAGKREAIMNLRVARFLREFLEAAGAAVFLTRTDDRFVALKDRADMAAAAGCDFMLSLHHNAGKNPRTNYGAVFYHLTPDTSPVSMDLARNIYFGLVEALRLPQVLDDGLLPDKLYYPAGFGVLRSATIPAVLLESSFYSNRKEEKRLTDLSYNRREAYGIFLGLARWAAGGIPSTRLLSPVGISTSKRPTIEYSLADGITERVNRNLPEQLIFSESVTARIDGKTVPVTISTDKAAVEIQPDSALSNGVHHVRVDLQNMFKNHNLPRTDSLVISAPVDSIDFGAATQYLPADSAAVMPVLLSLFDADGDAVWDSTRLSVRVNRGRVAPALPQLRDGRARVYYRAGNDFGLVYFVASTPGRTDTLLLSLTPPGQTWIVSGALLDDSTRAPVETARVSLNDTTSTLSDENGFYAFINPPVGADTLRARRDGYADVWQPVEIDSSRSAQYHFRLKAILGGLLHGKTIILDAALGDSVTGDFFSDSLSASRANLELAQQLASMLRWAGARPILVRNSDEWLSPGKRIRMVNDIADGWYLKIAYEKTRRDSLLAQMTTYPANKVGEEIAVAFARSFSRLPAARAVVLQNTEVPEVTLTNKTAVEVRIHCRRPDIFGRDLPALFRAIVEHARAERSDERTPTE